MQVGCRGLRSNRVWLGQVGDGIRFLNELATSTEVEAMTSPPRDKRAKKRRGKMSPGERAGEADPEAGMGQFLEPQLARDPQKKLVVRRQVRRALPSRALRDRAAAPASVFGARLSS